MLVTGASGFIASGLVDRLLSDGAVNGKRFDGLTVVDLAVPNDLADDPRVTAVSGSLTDPSVRAEALADIPDTVFHLASVPGRATADDVDLGYAVNVEATVALLEEVARARHDATVVFTSSIGVFGAPIPAALDDDTYPRPTMSYGAQKLMAETAFTDMVRREVFQGQAVRLSSVLARPRSARSAKSFASFVSDVFFAVPAGERFVFPVGPEASAWLMSRECCVDNLLHAATLPERTAGQPPVCTLPALRVRMDELVQALSVHYGRTDTEELVSYEPDEHLQAQFGSFPESRAVLAESLGFRADPSVAELIARVAVPLPTQKERV